MDKFTKSIIDFFLLLPINLKIGYYENFNIYFVTRIIIFIKSMKIQILVLSLFLLFNISQQAYSSSIASQLAYMSAISYESQATINAWNCSKCSVHRLVNTKAFSNTSSDIQGFTGYSPASNAIILAFRGSSNIKNWIINLSFNQVAYPKCTNCKVHSGFYSGYNGLKSTIISQLNTLVAAHKTAKIYLTGHSLGGAIALLAAVDIKDTFGHPSAFTTFGQPRVGNKQYAKWISEYVVDYRVVHYADIVPHLPAQIQGFAHGGSQVWYDKAMQTYKICQGESPDCSNSLGATSYNTGDHSMDIYLTLKVGQPSLMEIMWSKMKSIVEKFTMKKANLAFH